MIFKKEPVVIIAFVQAVIALVIGFGVDLTATQGILIVAVVTTLLAFIGRAAVTPNANL